jgi:hypothetical protein
MRTYGAEVKQQNMETTMKKIFLIVMTILFIAFAQSALATQILQITAPLTGDPRPNIPDDLKVNVTITVDDSAPKVANWVIDVDSLNHPNAKLDGFYFNLADSNRAQILSSPGPQTGGICELTDMIQRH